MSRIHEALKLAEAQRLPDREGPEASPLELGREGPAWRAVGPLDSMSPAESIASGHSLWLEDLRRRCIRPGWKLEPNADAFSTEKPSPLCAERFCTLRSCLYRLRENKPVRSLLITSALPGEGKTFVALNLALAIAREAGKRTLLLDANFGASRIHAHLGAPATPGLSDYLNGQADEFSIFQADPKLELFFVPAGSSVEHPCELLAKETLKGFLDRATCAFDWVIVDGPPVLAVADAGAVAEFCDGVLAVIRAGATAHDLVKTALQKLPRNRLLGVVLNGADEKPAHGRRFIEPDSGWTRGGGWSSLPAGGAIAPHPAESVLEKSTEGFVDVRRCRA